MRTSWLRAGPWFQAERHACDDVFPGEANGQEPVMKRFHAIALTLASTALFSLSSGAAIAQNVSGGDPYAQGYAAGASAKERNSFDAFDKGYRAGHQTAQNGVRNQADSAQAYDQGYEAGIARANRDREQAYNEGFEARGRQDQRVVARAFDNGFDAGDRRSRDELGYP